MKGNKLKGEITIETAIVFPIVMLMVLLLIYFSMFLHDIVKMKSYAYGKEVSVNTIVYYKSKCKVR